jgi:hypothetical protein
MVTRASPKSGEEGRSFTAFPAKVEEESAIVVDAILH